MYAYQLENWKMVGRLISCLIRKVSPLDDLQSQTDILKP